MCSSETIEPVLRLLEKKKRRAREKGEDEEKMELCVAQMLESRPASPALRVKMSVERGAQHVEKQRRGQRLGL